MSGDELTYAEAVDRLEQILAELEADDVDIDLLSERVRTAVELIRVCRERITAAEIEVKHIVAALDEDAGEQTQ